MLNEKEIKEKIALLIEEKLEELHRPDLFRKSHVGFASADDEKFGQLKEFIGEWHYMPEDILPGAKSVISYYVPFTRDVADEPQKSEHGSFRWGEAYEVINRHFEIISRAVIEYLESLGCKAASIPSTHTYDPAELKCKWSHRSAAVIAGLGVFGANRLVITEKGSAVRFCTVITDAEFTPEHSYEGPECLYYLDGSCGRCFDICPAKALKDGDIDKFICQDEINNNEKIARETSDLKEADTCGKCISVCPLAYIE